LKKDRRNLFKYTYNFFERFQKRKFFEHASVLIQYAAKKIHINPISPILYCLPLNINTIFHFLKQKMVSKTKIFFNCFMISPCTIVSEVG
ncbi:MAG: hypothetical protein QCI00_08740, partial [Candidatus Thermoplasmatota archaeon]|nr:hypothetical protein [Candidatus Thermoplasmatota archaeon]